MQLETLRYFIELVEAGSFYKAARQVHISQQGLNKAITTLESELGVKLVERGHQGVRPTRQGEALLMSAQRLLDDYDRMLDAVYRQEPQDSAARNDRTSIYISYYPSQIAASLLGKLNLLDIANLKEEPFKRILELAGQADGSDLFLVDLYPATREQLEREGGFVFEPILATRYGIVWKDGSPLAGSKSIHREQLAGIPLATNVQRDMSNLAAHIFEGFPELDIALGASSPQMTLNYARSSSQVATTFDSFGFLLAQQNPGVCTDGLHFTPLATPKSLCHLGFLYRKEARPNTRARYTIDLLRRWLRQNYPGYFDEMPPTTAL